MKKCFRRNAGRALVLLTHAALVASYLSSDSLAAPTVARIWNEELLHAISIDTARPTVHARNLFHLSTAMYDAWAAYDVTALPHIHHEKALRSRCRGRPPRSDQLRGLQPHPASLRNGPGGRRSGSMLPRSSKSAIK